MKMRPRINLRTVLLDWYCDVCGEVIEDGDGVIQVDAQAASARHFNWEKTYKAHYRGDPNAPFSWFDFAASDAANKEYPIAKWTALHYKCGDDDGGYWLRVERMRSIAAVLDLTAHLSEKNWFDDTNWCRWFYSIPGIAGAA